MQAKATIETEINSCCDNPQVFDLNGEPDVISACNADASYVGLAMDTSAIAATMLAKMSERRNNRFLDINLSGYPALLVKNSGLNSGLMIPQYTQAGLLGDMRILSTPSVIDNTPTCCNQEDYVSMGYNSSKKAIQVVDKLQYILAIELLSGFQAQQFISKDIKRSPATQAVFDNIEEHVPMLEEDTFLLPHIEYLKEIINKGKLIDIVENVVGKLN
jgi:histidine ammonia-lyase